ncbi:MAG: DUF4350 domain-containing protein [Armatimonadetes bacterium]|nr:DUF4350 domain-containing protein [Armatimonadota bacterium]
MRGRGKSVFLLMLGALALAAVFVWMSEGGGQKSPIRLVPSTHNVGATGTKALYLLLEKLGCDTGRWKHPLDDFLSQDAEMLVVIQPSLPVARKEAQALGRWVRKGHTLLLIGDNSALFDEFHIEPVEDPDPSSGDGSVSVQVTGDSPYLRNVRKMALQSPFRLSSVSSGKMLFSDGKGGVLLSQDLGKGHVLALCDPHIADNTGIKEEDNSILLTNLIHENCADSKVLFDEFHHGYVEQRAAREMITPGMRIGIVQIVLALVLFYLSRSFRFGAARPMPSKRIRSSLEYVISLANMYRKISARSIAARSLARGLKRRMARALGAQPNAPSETIAELGAKRWTISREELLQAMNMASRGAKSDLLSDRELLSLAQQFEAIWDKTRASGPRHK